MVTLDNNGLNTAITSTILPDATMREIGFTDHRPTHWYYSARVGHEIFFSVTIPKDGGRLRIDVLDEAFGQPYDYQNILSRHPKLQFALEVKENVEREMKKLSKAGIIQGFKPGMYI